MGIKKVAKGCGIFAGLTILGAGLGAAGGAVVDQQKGEFAQDHADEARAKVTAIEDAVTNSEKRMKSIQQYGESCIALVTHYSVGGVLHDKPEEVATANITREPGAPCGTSTTEVLVAYSDISGALQQRHDAGQLDYEQATQKHASLAEELQNDEDFNGLLYLMGAGAVIGACYGAVYAKEYFEDSKKVGNNNE